MLNLKQLKEKCQGRGPKRKLRPVSFYYYKSTHAPHSADSLMTSKEIFQWETEVTPPSCRVAMLCNRTLVSVHPQVFFSARAREMFSQAEFVMIDVERHFNDRI